jgi:methylenetetrahydrofolate reductase (NADPH)
MLAGSCPNLIREAIETGDFLVTLEYTPEVSAIPFEDAIRRIGRDATRIASDPRVRGFNICDRVRSPDSHDTVTIGRRLADMSGKMPLLHLAGKDRTEPEMESIVRRALRYGLQNLLLVSGDKLVPDIPRPVRYYDSVNAIRLARQLAPGVLIAATVSPFKYREDELLGQYLKMVKKVRAGADYIIANAGWDMAKFQELVWYRDARSLRFPLVANLFLLARGLARKLNRKLLPGIRVTDDLLQKVEEEYPEPASGKTSSRRRLALQIVGVKHMGYAGVHLSGVNTYEEHSAVLDLAAELERRFPSIDAWRDAWREAHTHRNGRIVSFAPPNALYLFPNGAPATNSLPHAPDPGCVRAGAAELRTYRRLELLDRALFRPGSLGASLLGPLVRAADRAPLGCRALLALERNAKGPLLGCQMCGFCRLPYTFFACPETCPKGLANGPCAGTHDGMCEFNNQQCTHNRTYRIAKATGRLADLEELMIPAVTGTRGTSAWANYYRGTVPAPIRLTKPGN